MFSLEPRNPPSWSFNIPMPNQAHFQQYSSLPCTRTIVSVWTWNSKKSDKNSTVDEIFLKNFWGMAFGMPRKLVLHATLAHVPRFRHCYLYRELSVCLNAFAHFSRYKAETLQTSTRLGQFIEGLIIFGCPWGLGKWVSSSKIRTVPCR